MEILVLTDEWRSAILGTGGQSVMTSGTPMLPLWYAGNWDSVLQVGNTVAQKVKKKCCFHQTCCSRSFPLPHIAFMRTAKNK